MELIAYKLSFTIYILYSILTVITLSHLIISHSPLSVGKLAPKNRV